MHGGAANMGLLSAVFWIRATSATAIKLAELHIWSGVSAGYT